MSSELLRAFFNQVDMIFCTRWTWWGVSNQWVNCRQPKLLVGSFHIASSFHKTELHLLALCVALIRWDFLKLRVLQFFYFWATKSFGYEAANDIKYSFNDLFQVNSWLRGGTTRNRPSSGNPSTFSQPRQKPSQSGWFCSGTSCAPQKRKRRGTKPNWSQSGRKLGSLRTNMWSPESDLDRWQIQKCQIVDIGWALLVWMQLFNNWFDVWMVKWLIELLDCFLVDWFFSLVWL